MMRGCVADVLPTCGDRKLFMITYLCFLLSSLCCLANIIFAFWHAIFLHRVLRLLCSLIWLPPHSSIANWNIRNVSVQYIVSWKSDKSEIDKSRTTCPSKEGPWSKWRGAMKHRCHMQTQPKKRCNVSQRKDATCLHSSPETPRADGHTASILVVAWHFCP